MLKEFYAQVVESDESIASLWSFDEYETKFGTREELVFAGKGIILSRLPSGDFSLLIIQVQEPKVYQHARYLIQALLYQVETLELKLYGSAYQAIFLLQQIEEIEVEQVFAKGTLEHVDRFNNHSEREVSSLVGVRLSKRKG